MTFAILLMVGCLLVKHPADGRGRRQMITVMLLCCGKKNIQIFIYRQ